MWPPGSADTVCPRPPLTVTFDCLTLKLMCESHLVGNLPSKFGHARPLGSRIIRYVRDGWTERRTDGRTDGQKQRLLFHSLRSEHNNYRLPVFAPLKDIKPPLTRSTDRIATSVKINNKNLAIANRSHKSCVYKNVEGIYRPNNPLTVISRLTVTQGHCKRHH